MTTVGDLKYTLNANTATVVSLVDKNKTEVIIPATITVTTTTYRVTAIGNNAFDNSNNDIELKKVTLKRTVI